MKWVKPSGISGAVDAPPSKSAMQRALIAAALADGESTLSNPSLCDDSLAAMRVVGALGAEVEPGLRLRRWMARRETGTLPGTMRLEEEVIVVRGRGTPHGSVLDCGESGTCMRMIAPVAALHGTEFTITGSGSLMERPVGMVEGPLRALGARCETRNGKPPITVKGPLHGGRAAVDGSESSQFVSGLLMALPRCREDSELEVSGLKSRPYVSMTLSVMEDFGVGAGCDSAMGRFTVRGGQEYRAAKYRVCGDWSAAAFLLVAGAIAGKAKVRGLKSAASRTGASQGSSSQADTSQTKTSHANTRQAGTNPVGISQADASQAGTNQADTNQADSAITDALASAGAKVRRGRDGVEVSGGELAAFAFDATACPDLFPPLAVLACSCRGTSTILGASRLRHKESDRAAALAGELGKLGASIRVAGDRMEITGRKLKGGSMDSRGDHRMAMAGAVAGLASEKGVQVENEGCVSKSYPGFFRDLGKLGAIVQ